MVEPGIFVDKSSGETIISDDSDSNAGLIAASVLAGGAALGGGAAIIALASKDKPSSGTDTTAPIDGGKQGALAQDDEEVIIEPAPQAGSGPVHGIIIPESSVKQAVKDADTPVAPAIVISSPPTSPTVETHQDADDRTVELIKPTPGVSIDTPTASTSEREAGEIFSHPVWNQSISPFLHYSLENTPEGVRQRLAESNARSRPGSSGNDTLSTKHQRNVMQAFWNMMLFGWLGSLGGLFGFGRQKKQKSSKATTKAATS